MWRPMSSMAKATNEASHSLPGRPSCSYAGTYGADFVELKLCWEDDRCKERTLIWPIV